MNSKESKGANQDAAFAYLPARRRKLSTTGILLSVFYRLLMSMAASTVMPAMAVELGGIGGYTFGLSLYLVCTAVSIPSLDLEICVLLTFVLLRLRGTPAQETNQ